LCKSEKASDFEFRELDDSKGSGLDEPVKEPRVREREVREVSIELEMGQLPTIPESESLLQDARIAAASCNY
jgi:hypothetical protein